MLLIFIKYNLYDTLTFAIKKTNNCSSNMFLRYKKNVFNRKKIYLSCCKNEYYEFKLKRQGIYSHRWN